MTKIRTSIMASDHTGIRIVPINDIRCFRAEDKYTTVYSCTGDILILDPIQELEVEFKAMFTRIHRSSLIATRYLTATRIERLNPDNPYSLKLFAVLDGTDVTPAISKRHVAKVNRYLRALAAG